MIMKLVLMLISMLLLVFVLAFVLELVLMLVWKLMLVLASQAGRAVSATIKRSDYLANCSANTGHKGKASQQLRCAFRNEALTMPTQ